MKNRLFALLVIAVMTLSVGYNVATAAGHQHEHRHEYIMSDEGFVRLLELVDEESFSSGKLRIIEAASLGGRFSCRQVATLVQKFSFSSEKKKVVELMANSIVEFHDIEQILDQFNFDSDKREVLDLLGITYIRL